MNFPNWKQYVSKAERAFGLLAIWFMFLALLALFIKDKEIVKLYTGITFVSSLGILLIVAYSGYERWVEAKNA